MSHHESSAKFQNARGSKMREVPNCARSQNARSPKRRLRADDATFGRALRCLAPFNALWDFAHHGSSRTMGFRALWHFAHYGTSRLWHFALYGTSRSMGLV